MNPLIVNLPAIVTRRRALNTKQIDSNKKKKLSSAERVAKFRAKLKKNPKQFLEQKEKKRQENQKYKDKVRALRKQDTTLDEKLKKTQRVQRKNHRKKQNRMDKLEKEQKEHDERWQKECKEGRKRKLEALRWCKDFVCLTPQLPGPRPCLM